ncbi:MAG: discoidin domain-containing protein [Flavobacteriaceae bacterium]
MNHIKETKFLFALTLIISLYASVVHAYNIKGDNDVWTVNIENQQALNVVFFIPTDFPSDDKTVESRIALISDMMLYIQAWYKKQMDVAGFGAKTFGLLTNQKGQVRINLVKGQHPTTYYGGNSNLVKEEVDAYFEKHPEFNSSVHTLVLGDYGSKIGFQGIGYWCYATSEDFTLTDTGEEFHGFKLKNAARLGGIMHELGHGLNLPHNCQTAAQVPNVALMSNGNRVYAKSPEKIFLTQSSCAILSNNALFNKTTNGILYYKEMPATVVKTLSIAKNTALKTIHINGTFTSNTAIPYVYAGFDFISDNANPPNDNYDEITYLTVPVKENENLYSFDIEVAYADLFNNFQEEIKDEAVIEINLISENGFRLVPYSHYYTTDIATQIPNTDIELDYTAFNLSDRSGWSITANSAPENKTDTFTNMIDGNESTFWHSNWPYSVEKHGPHTITINMGTTKTINGIYLLSARSGTQFRPKHVTVLTSLDNKNWDEANKTLIPAIEAAERFTIDFEKPAEARFIKILVDEIYKSGKGKVENLVLTEVDVF